MHTRSESPAIDESVKDWDTPIRKAFNELRNSIAGLSKRPSGDDVLIFRRFVSEELQCVSSAFNAYFDGVGVAGSQCHSAIVSGSELANLVPKASEDILTEMFGASEVEIDCNRVMESWDNESCRNLDNSSYCNIVRNEKSQSRSDTSRSKVATESQHLAAVHVNERSGNSPGPPLDCFVPEVGVCPLNLIVSTHGFGTTNLPEYQKNPSTYVMSSNSDLWSSFSDNGDGICYEQSSSPPSIPESEPYTAHSDTSLDICTDPALVDESDQPLYDTITQHSHHINIPVCKRQYQRTCSQVAQESATIIANGMPPTEGHQLSAEPELESVDGEDIQRQSTNGQKQSVANILLENGGKNDKQARLVSRERLKRTKSLKTRHRHRTRTSTLFETHLPQYVQQGLLTTSPSRTEKVFQTFMGELGKCGNVEQASFLTRLYHAIGSPDAFLQLNQALKMARTCMFPDLSTAESSPSAAVRALDSLDSTSSLSHILRRHYLLRLLQFRVDQETKYKTSRQRPKTTRRLKYDISRIDNIGREYGLYTDPIELNGGGECIHGRSDSLALRDLYELVYPHEKYDCQENRGQKKKLERLKTRLACARTWFTFKSEYSVGVLALIPSGGDHKISIDQVERLPIATLNMFLGHLQRGRGGFIASVSQRLSPDVFNILCGKKLSGTSQFALETVDELSLAQMAPDSHDLEILVER